MTAPDLEQRAIDVIRGLAMDAPHAARSGHQGTAMALAPLAHVLWTRIMRYDARDPEWPDRDRFVLSAGHASILLYSMLHLTGYDLTLDDLRAFRQWGSKTPGHPERGHTAGVEVTTGPLGQGLGNAVGMAIAERQLRARFGADVVDHRTFCIVSDGDLSEGLSHEASSLAGHLGLGRLVCVYDDNHVSIDGKTELALTDDAAARFRAYGWHVDELGEAAEDLDAIEAALQRAIAEEAAPSLLILRSHIAYPSPSKTDDPATHGYALKDDDIREAKAVMGLPDEAFHVPDDVRELYRAAGARGQDDREAWEKRLEAYEGDRGLFDATLSTSGLPGWEDAIPRWEPGEQVATRVASGKVLQALADHVPALLAGGADLTSNTGTVLRDHGVQSADEPQGRQLYFGVREHAMAATMTGMAHHGGVLPVGGTFLVFSDYCRPSVRLASLSRAKVIYSFTHDSVGVGEDGPTHQPVEHVAALRAIPGLRVIRPADANETAEAWRLTIDHDGPTALILSRQDLPVLDGTAGVSLARGAHVLRAAEDPDVVLVATGSEVHVAIAAAELLAGEGIHAQVTSLPCWELLEEQTEAVQDEVLPPEVPILSIEAGVSLGWDRWADDFVSIERFGASAPGDRVLAELGFTAPNVADRARALVHDLEGPA
ncbi:MAG: transketolase [Acidimicrobiales bacterium]